jgi:hypothetical protein
MPSWRKIDGLVERPGVLLAVASVLVFAGFFEAILVYLWAPWDKGQIALHLAYAVVTATVILVLGRATRPASYPPWVPWAVMAGGFAVTLLLAQVALQAFPNSGDEYNYNYMAETFRHGRLWNVPLPENLEKVLKTYYIADRDGKRVSQYPPGWPVVLSVFRAIHVPQFANAVVGLLACVFLWLGLGRLRVSPGARFGAFVLGALAPFTLFNDASFFNHPLTAAALLAIIWLDLRDADDPSAWNRAGIGVAFAVLLTTRYEAFLIAFILFALDGLGRRRWRFIPWSVPAAVAGAPIAALLLWYNWRITGSPFETTLAWASPEITYGPYSVGIEGPHSLARGWWHTLGWTLSWQDFASVLIGPFYVVALWRRIRMRSVRWFDLLLPVLIIFFFFYPDFGGFQYGPRYWYLGHAAMPLTVAAGLSSAGGLWNIGSWRLDPVRVAVAQLASFTGFVIGYAVFAHLQIDVRMAPLRIAAAAPRPALVLVPTQEQRYVPWQKAVITLNGMDYTRNGIGGFGPLLMGSYISPDRTRLLCEQFPDRHIFKLVLDTTSARGHLEAACTPDE